MRILNISFRRVEFTPTTCSVSRYRLVYLRQYWPQNDSNVIISLKGIESTTIASSVSRWPTEFEDAVVRRPQILKCYDVLKHWYVMLCIIINIKFYSLSLSYNKCQAWTEKKACVCVCVLCFSKHTYTHTQSRTHAHAHTHTHTLTKSRTLILHTFLIIQYTSTYLWTYALETTSIIFLVNIYSKLNYLVFLSVCVYFRLWLQLLYCNLLFVILVTWALSFVLSVSLT